MNRRAYHRIIKNMYAIILAGMLLFLCMGSGSSPVAHAQDLEGSARIAFPDDGYYYVALPVVMYNYAPAGWTTIFSDDFEGDFPGLWSLYTTDGYAWGKRSCRAFAGSNSAWAIGGGASGAGTGCFSDYPANTETKMTYGPFSLEGATRAELTYKLWLVSENKFDFVCWAASTNNINFSGDCDSGNSNGWIDRTWDLSNVPTLGNLLGESMVWITLRFTSDSSTNYEGGYVDNLVLRMCPEGANCP
jgi:hypothetical protein